jgi:putative DNA primase/helicase
MDEPVDISNFRARAHAIVAEKKAQSNEQAHMPSPEFSEDQLALQFVTRHGTDLRYVAAWSKWLSWTDTHWQHEDTLAAYDLARKICREAASQCNKASEAKAIAKARTVAAIEQLAKSDRAIAAREDYCTKITAVAPDINCPIPMFLDFLHTIFAGDNELIDLAIA